jgi:hypothetical protein
MKQMKVWLSSLLAMCLGLFSVAANAVAPAYVATSIAAAKTEISEVIAASADDYLLALVAVAGLFFVGRLIKRAFK